jgi:hypothetical protein
MSSRGLGLGFGLGFGAGRRRSSGTPVAPLTIEGELPNGTINVDYLSSGDVAVRGGIGPFAASLAGGPAGLSVSVDGRNLVFSWSDPA